MTSHGSKAFSMSMLFAFNWSRRCGPTLTEDAWKHAYNAKHRTSISFMWHNCRRIGDMKLNHLWSLIPKIQLFPFYWNLYMIHPCQRHDLNRLWVETGSEWGYVTQYFHFKKNCPPCVVRLYHVFHRGVWISIGIAHYVYMYHHHTSAVATCHKFQLDKCIRITRSWHCHSG